MNEYQVDQLLDKAAYYEDHRMWLHASQLYLRLIAEFPREAGYAIKLAGIYAEMENYSAAEKILLDGIQPDQENTEVLYALGMVFFHQRRLDRALFYFDQAARMNMPDAHFRMGLIFQALGQFPKAERHFTETISIDSKYYEAYLALGDVHLRSNRTLKAMAVLQKAVELDEYNWRGHMLLAVTYEQANRRGDALRSYRMVAALHMSEAEVISLVADALFQMHEIDEARNVLEQAIVLTPNSTELLVRLGKIALFKSDRSAAKQYFLRALALDPDCREAEQHLRFVSGDAKNNK
jgi:Flp pilus assembly protein TadD